MGSAVIRFLGVDGAMKLLNCCMEMTDVVKCLLCEFGCYIDHFRSNRSLYKILSHPDGTQTIIICSTSSLHHRFPDSVWSA